MADTPAFQSHHIIEQQAVEKSALIGKLQEFGLFNIDDTRNLLNMPADPELAAKMGVSPHNGGPLKAYSDGLIAELNIIQNSNVGKAAMAGELEAQKIVAEKINNLRDTMRAGLINGNLFTNTPKDMSTDVVKAKTAEFFGELESYSQKHADQISKFSKVAGNEWGLATTSEERIKAALDAIEQDGVKAAKGSAEAARNSLHIAIAQAREAGTLTLSEAFMKGLKDVAMKGLKGIAAAGVAADIALSTAEAKNLAEKGDVAGAHSVMNALGARLSFGWLGVEMGSVAGPYGAVLGGLAGLIGGEALVKGIEKAANQLTGLLNSNGTKTYEAKAPEATINPDGSTTITTFNPDNNKPSSNKTYDKDSKLTGETKFEYDALTNNKITERMFNADGKQTTIKTFDRTTGQQTSQSDYNTDGTKTERNFDTANGNITQEKRFDKDGKLTFDSVEEARKQAEAEKAAAEKAEAQRIAAEQQAAAQAEAERRAAEDARLRADPVGSLTDDQIRAYDRTQAFHLLNLVFNMPDKQSYEHQMHLMLQRFGALNPRIQGDMAALIINGGKGFDPIRFPTDTPGLHPSSPTYNPLAIPLPPIDWNKGVIQGKPSGINVCFPSTGQCSGFPVFMDMNRDGVIDVMPLADKQTAETSLSSSIPHFDWNADGIPDQTAWVGPQDGMLVIDLAKDGTDGADGVINQPKEIAFALWKTEEERVAELKEKGIDDTGRPVTDLEGLRWAFDTNHDNILDSRDARWNEFRVWQDANQNGIADAGELMTMDQAGIKLINLMPSNDGSKAFPDGSAITGTSSAEMTDGTKMLVGDVSLAYRPSLSNS